MIRATHRAGPDRPSGSPGSKAGGLLASVDRFDRWLAVVMIVVVVTCAARYVSRHGVDDLGIPIIIGAIVLAVLHAAAIRMAPAAPAHPSSSARDGVPRLRAAGPALAAVAVAAVWGVLTVVAPSFAWCAVPVAFAVLRVLPFWPAIGVVVCMTVLVPVAWWRLLTDPDPTVVVGPVALAVVIVVAYHALDHESRARQRLVDELIAAREDLAEADRREGALAERARLSREIHDSVGQGLSSITLMLGAATREWDRDPATAHRHVATASEVVRASLEDVRRVVRDLAPAELAGDRAGALGGGVEAALRRVLTHAGPGIATELRVDGQPVAIPPEVGTALTRTAQGALANVVEHSAATRVIMTLTRHPDELRLDVYDNGRGFDTTGLAAQETGRAQAPGLRGRGLAGIVARAQSLGGAASVESTPGAGTIVSVSFPLTADVGRGA